MNIGQDLTYFWAIIACRKNERSSSFIITTVNTMTFSDKLFTKVGFAALG
jgi:hypothetical protein